MHSCLVCKEVFEAVPTKGFCTNCGGDLVKYITPDFQSQKIKNELGIQEENEVIRSVRFDILFSFISKLKFHVKAFVKKSIEYFSD